MTPVVLALWMVESSLDRDLCLAEIARHAGVSRHHLTRAFGAATGIPLIRYVRARRLTEAARTLAAGAPDILAVALDAGYGSHEAFTRAFHDHFGMPPEAVRARGHTQGLPCQERIFLPALPAQDMAPPRLAKRPAMTLVGLTGRFGPKPSQSFVSLWRRFDPLQYDVPGRIGDALYDASFNRDVHGHFDYLRGVNVDPAAPTPPGLFRLALKPQRYAIYVHAGHVASLRTTIQSIQHQVLPAHGLTLDDAPSLRRYGPEFDATTGIGPVELWFPIQDGAA